MTFDEQAATLDRQDVAKLLASHQQITTSFKDLTDRHDELSRQLEWFKRQLFGSKSERRLVDPDGRQLMLGEWQKKDAPDIFMAYEKYESDAAFALHGKNLAAKGAEFGALLAGAPEIVILEEV